MSAAASPSSVSSLESDIAMEQLSELRQELAHSYAQNAKHAQSLFEYMDKAKSAEAKAAQLSIQLQEAASQLERAGEEKRRLEEEMTHLRERNLFMKEDFESRKAMIEELEQSIVSTREESYAKNKELDSLRQQVTALEGQVLRSAELLNNMNEELARMRARGPASNSPSAVKSHSDSSASLAGLSGASSSGDVVFDPSALVGMQQGVPLGSHRPVPACHSEPITQVAYNMHGRIFATASLDSNVKIWDSLAGTTIRVLKGHGRSIRCVAISMDDRFVLTGTAANTAVVHSIRGKQIHTLVGHTDKVTGCAFVDGSTVVTGSHDRSLRLWDINRGVCLSGGDSIGSRVNDVCATGTNVFVTANHDGSIRLCDSRSLRESDQMQCHRDIVTSVACSSDYNHILASSRDNTLSFIDSRKMEVVHELRHPRYQARSEYGRASLSSCGKYAISGGKCGSLFVWSTDTGKIYKKVKPVFDSGITCVKVAPSGFQMAVGDMDGNVVLWDS